VIFVVVGSLALGIKVAANMRGRLNALRDIERILSYLEGELRCRHSVLGEAFYNVAIKSREPYRRWLLELSEWVNPQENEYKEKFEDFYSLWCNSLIQLKDNTFLNSKDIGQLYDVGKALGYLDIESQQMNLNLERELLHNSIRELDKDIGTRMKNVIVMCFLGGIMTVIALL